MLDRLEDPLLTDLLLAIAHHLLMFALFAILVIRAVLIRAGMDGRRLRRVVGVDRLYGISAALILVVGFSRVFFGAKGALFYLGNPVFWAKMIAIAAVGALSVVPTRNLIEWSRAARADAAFVPPADAMTKVRRFITAEVAVFPLILIFAAAMARGFGL
jgi:putative membrane protein